MTDREMLLANVLADPDSDRPRIEMADWLEMNDEVTLAEFIRVQCALASPAINYADPSCTSLRCRAMNADKDLNAGCFVCTSCWSHLREHERELLALQPIYIKLTQDEQPLMMLALDRGRAYRRGFIEEVTLDWGQFQMYEEAIRAVTPLRVVNLLSVPEVGYHYDEAQIFVKGVLVHAKAPDLDRSLYNEKAILACLKVAYPKLQFRLRLNGNQPSMLGMYTIITMTALAVNEIHIGDLVAVDRDGYVRAAESGEFVAMSAPISDSYGRRIIQIRHLADGTEFMLNMERSPARSVPIVMPDPRIIITDTTS